MKKDSSVFGTVSTLILTAGMVFPALAITISWAIPQLTAIEPEAHLIVSACLMTIAYIVGTFHSFGYIRKSLFVRSPAKCILPAVVGFALLVAAGVGGSLKTLRDKPPSLFAVIVFDALIVIMFSVIVAKGFAAIAREQAKREKGFPTDTAG